MTKTKKPKTKNYHHGNLREALVHAAFKYLEKNTAESLSLRGLAKLAGVSQAAPYRHFKDRDGLLAAVSLEGFNLKLEYLTTAYIKFRHKPEELYHQFARAYFEMGLDHPQYFKIMMTSPVKPSPEHPELYHCAALNYALLKIMIEDCQKAGVLGAGDPYHKALHCWSVVAGFTTLYADGRLDWLGVTKQNAIAALRALTEQFLAGHHAPLAKSGFAPFGPLETKINLENLIAGERELRRRLKDGQSRP
jgi:AcrR family transcriptional regulator